MRTLKSLFLLPFLLQTCSDSPNETSETPISADPVVITESVDGEFNVNRNAYFGELHVHSMYSYDAFILGGIASPDEAYQFAKGSAITMRLVSTCNWISHLIFTLLPITPIFWV